MGINYHFICDICNKDEYAFRGGRLIPSDELNEFLSNHIYKCDGSFRIMDSMYLYDINDDIPNEYLNKTYHELVEKLKVRDDRISYLEKKLKNIETQRIEYIEVDRNASLKLTIQHQEIHIKSLIDEMKKLNNYIDELKKE